MPIVIPSEQSQIRLSASGSWFHRDEPFENIKIIEFFHQAICMDADGRYFLKNRYEGKEEHVYFEVEDVALFVRAFEFDAQQQHYQVLLNTGEQADVDIRTLEENRKGVMYCKVLGGQRARFTDRALHQLADLAETDDQGIYLMLAGEKVYASKP
jgi:hypothetical protein